MTVISTWDETPTCGAQLVHAERVLAQAGSLAPWEEAAELLSYTLDVPIPALLAQPSMLLRPVEVRRFAGMVERRAAGEALPRITGHMTFMGLDIGVGPDGPLIATGAERLVEIALEWARHHAPGPLSAVEIGTGSGSVALALAALEPRFTRIYALDTSTTVLEVAAANGARYLLNLVIAWLVGDGLDAVPEPVDLILSTMLGHSHAASMAGPATPSSTAARGRAEQTGHEATSRSVRLIQQAPAKLLPGGALIVGYERARESETLALVGLALPDAHVWVDSLAGGEVIAVAQLPGR